MNEFLFLGGIAALWAQVKAVIARVRSLVLVRVRISGNAAHAVRSYALRHWRVLPASDRFVRSCQGYVRPLQRMAEVAWEGSSEQPAVFLAGWVPIFLGGVKHSQSTVPDQDELAVSGLRWLVNLDTIIADALAEHNSNEVRAGQGRYHVRRVFGRSQNSGGNGNGLAAPRDSGYDQNNLFRAAKIIGWRSRGR